MHRVKNMLPGILLCLAIALPAWIIGKAVPLVGGPVFGILAGMIAALIRRPEKQMEGLRFVSKNLLQYSIILLGFEMNFISVLQVGVQSFWIMMFTLSAAFLTAYVVGHALKVRGNPAILIGVGVSICGGSAIAATAPIIGAKDEEVAQSISTIFLFNIIAVFIFPLLGHWMGLSDAGFGMWAGTAINDTSSVVAAGASWSDAAGNGTALQLATIVKLTRTLMIVPITFVLFIWTAKQRKKAAEGNFHFARIFPWFVVGFAVAALMHTFLPLPEGLTNALTEAGKFMIVMAMAAIGLQTDFKKMAENGWRPIALGGICWAAVATVSLVVQQF